MRDFNTNTANNDEWLTPPEIISALGEFDLDPCSPVNRPWSTARKHLTIHENGLLQDWSNMRVWLNPPYGKFLEAWLNRMAMHNNGIALIFARTETKAFHNYVYPYANSILFIKGRVQFYDINGIRAHNANAPSVLVGYNEYNSEMIEVSGIQGFHISLRPELFLIGIQSQDNDSWRIIVNKAFETLKGNSSLDDIYTTVLKLAPNKVKRNKHYKEKIRQILQLHFNHIEKGVWATN